MTYEFDKAVPIPTSVERVGVNIELLRAMQPGESKWWSEDDSKKAARFYRVAKKLGIPIIIRKVGKADPRGLGVRMWRTEGGPAVVVVDPLAQAAEAAVRAVKAKAPPPVVKAKAKAAAVPKGNSGAVAKLAKATGKARPVEGKRKAATA